jgi:hypothetical protein
MMNGMVTGLQARMEVLLALLKGSHLSIDFCDEGIVTVDELRA